MDSTTHKCSHEYNRDTIHNPYDFFVHYRWKVSHLSNLRSEDIELEGTYCAFCGQLSGNCTCEASITEDYPDDGGGFGDEGGGENGGDDGESAGGSGGGNATSQMTSIAITNATIDAVETIINSDDNGIKTARCNHGVQEAFKNVFGIIPTDLNCTANQMIQNLRNSSYWESISMDQAMSYASDGWFVIGAWENTSGGAGHVVVIVPGSAGAWPLCMDTGRGMRTSSQGLNYSFGKDKRSNVEYFKYK